MRDHGRTETEYEMQSKHLCREKSVEAIVPGNLYPRMELIEREGQNLSAGQNMISAIKKCQMPAQVIEIDGNTNDFDTKALEEKYGKVERVREGDLFN